MKAFAADEGLSCRQGPLRVAEGVRSFCNLMVHVCRKYLHSDTALSGFRFRNVPMVQESEGSRQTTFIVTWGTSDLNTLKGQEARRHSTARSCFSLAARFHRIITLLLL